MVEFITGDCLEWMRGQPAGRFDLVFGSPPYADARYYLEGGENLGIARKCAQWVEWMLAVTVEAHRICRGPVLWVAAGVTRKRNYWPACEGLVWEWWKRGGDFQLYRPCIFHRVSIPGSGGKDWFRSDWEYVLCFKHAGALPWADNTACGRPPKHTVGGPLSYRNAAGRRKNARDEYGFTEGHVEPSESDRKKNGRKVQTRRKADGSRLRDGTYRQPKLANPGNVVRCHVGGGLMGHPLCHENEAPFPESLAEFFVRSLCPPGGLVLDPFSGSGTTAAVCTRFQRSCVAIDLRASQNDIAQRRLKGIQIELIA